MAARQSANQHGHYDGQPAPTAGARGLLHTKLAPFASDEGGASTAARQSAISTAQRSLKITERCTMKLTVVAIPWAITNAMIWTENRLMP